jgi:hypothetical protein
MAMPQEQRQGVTCQITTATMSLVLTLPSPQKAYLRWKGTRLGKFKLDCLL